MLIVHAERVQDLMGRATYTNAGMNEEIGGAPMRGAGEYSAKIVEYLYSFGLV